MSPQDVRERLEAEQERLRDQHQCPRQEFQCTVTFMQGRMSYAVTRTEFLPSGCPVSHELDEPIEYENDNVEEYDHDR